MIEIEINGQKIEAQEGSTIIEAADAVGIYIPRFCYHKKLSIAANCRMCLVEVEKAPKPMPACATPITAQMKVFTASERAVDSQRAVMEYLLINHPLDCPICDQGGECELQDLAMGFGKAYSFYEEGKRSVYDPNLGPLIETDMTRCIQCTRCVRFGEEVAGLRELGVISRGENEQITTYVKHFMQSEISGNIIDLCPVGALTAKPSQFSIRPWDLTEHPAISPHDNVGTNIFIHSRFQEYNPQRIVMRVVARENENINETWISDRDRFSYEALYHADRIYLPRKKVNGVWQETTWPDALNEISQKLQTIIKQDSADQIAALASSHSTLEEFYLLQKLIRALGSNHIDYRLRQLDYSNKDWDIYPNLGMQISEIEKFSHILLIGSNVRYEQPIISQKIFKATQENNTKIWVINPVDYSFNFKVQEKIIQRDLVRALQDIINSSLGQQLKSSDNLGIFLGPYALNHPEAGLIYQLTQALAEQSKAQVGILAEGGNSLGAWMAGAIPHQGPMGAKLSHSGLPAKSLLTDEARKAYLLFNIEPEFDSAYSEQALHALAQAKLVVCMNTFLTKSMEQYADYILPLAPFTETSGTYINMAGTWQHFDKISIPQSHSKAGWQMLCVLAKVLNLTGFDYKTSKQVREEIEALKNQDEAKQIFTNKKQPLDLNVLNARTEHDNQLLRVSAWPMYCNDALVRRAKALQQTLDAEIFTIQLNSRMAHALGLKNGDWVHAIQANSRISLPLMINEGLADYTALIYSGIEQTAGFGAAMQPIQLEKAEI